MQYVLAALTLLLGGSILWTTVTRRPRLAGEALVVGVLSGVLVAALGVGICVLAVESTRFAQEQPANEHPHAAAEGQAVTPEWERW